MKTEEWFKEKLEYFKEDFGFRLETLILDLTEKICEKMQQKNISRTSLSKSLSVSPPAVTKILNGTSNFTLKTLLSLADALELDLNVSFKEKADVYSKVIDFSLRRSQAISEEEEQLDVSTADIDVYLKAEEEKNFQIAAQGF